MKRGTPQISIYVLWLALPAVFLVFITWWSDAKFLTMPMAGAFIGALLTRPGMRIGTAIGAVIVVVNAMYVEKDPSGLAPTEIVIPFSLVVFAVPVLLAAWLGKTTRAWLPTKDSDSD